MSSKKKLTFLVDHCVDAALAQYLSGLKKVKSLSFEDVGLTQRSIDPHVIAKATQAGAIVVTGDKRFTEDYIPCCTHQGIIKLKTKVATRLTSLKRFMRMKEKHLAWKGVTHLFENEIVINQHNGEQLSLPYLK